MNGSVVTLILVITVALRVPAAADSGPCATIGPTPDAAGAGQWTRAGLEWVWTAPPPRIIDRCRVKKQMEAGCSENKTVRFGDTAVMRGTLGRIDWPPEVRRQMAAAALIDAPEQAYALIDAAYRENDLDNVQHAVLVNQKILTALQFNDVARARLMLEAAGLPADLPTPLLSDRLLWSVLVVKEHTSAQQWRTVLDEKLAKALRSDPTHFSVRVWRLLAWFKARSDEVGSGCIASLKSLSTRVLDVSEASACPLLVGHTDHVMGRLLKSRSLSSSNGKNGAWRSFAIGLLAHLTRNQPVKDAALADLNRRSRGTPCAGLMVRELAALGKLP